MKKQKFLVANLLVFAFIFFTGFKVSASYDVVKLSSDYLIDETKPSVLSGCSTYGTVGVDNSGAGSVKRYIGKFNLNSTTAGFTKAILRTGNIKSSTDSPQNYVLYKLTSEAGVSTTFDINSAVTPVSNRSGLWEYDITNIVNDWMANPANNYGYIIKRLDESVVGSYNTSIMFNCANNQNGGAVLVFYYGNDTYEPLTALPANPTINISNVNIAALSDKGSIIEWTTDRLAKMNLLYHEKNSFNKDLNFDSFNGIMSNGVFLYNETEASINHNFLIPGDSSLPAGSNFYYQIVDSNSISGYTPNKTKILIGGPLLSTGQGISVSEQSVANSSNSVTLKFKTNVPTNVEMIIEKSGMSSDRFEKKITDYTTDHEITFSGLKNSSYYNINKLLLRDQGHYYWSAGVNNQNINVELKTLAAVGSTSLPDLIITDTYIYPNTPKSGESIPSNGGIMVKIKNIGTSVAFNLGNINFAAAIYDDLGVLQAQNLITMSEHPTLQPNEEFTYMIKPLSFLQYKLSGSYVKLKIVVDTLNNLEEKNESNNNLEKILEITSNSSMPITNTSLATGTIGTYYAEYLQTGASGLYTWSATGLPTGLSLTGNKISGTPTTAGTYAVTVTLTLTSGQTVSKQFSLVVATTGTPSITIVSPNGGEQWEIGKTYQVTWKVSGFSPNDYVKVLIRKGLWDSGNAVNYGNTLANTEAYRNIAILNPVGNDTSFYEVGKNYFIDISLVTSNGEPLATDFSDATFSIIATNSPTISEQVKCIFKGSQTEQKCYLAGDNEKFSCTGKETCVIDVNRAKGEKVTWKSSCGGYGYTIMDGQNEFAEFDCTAAVIDMNNAAKDIVDNKYDSILSELNQLRDTVKEQQNEIKYLKSMTNDLKNVSDQIKSAINDFITYGVDSNTQKLGAGERAAVINSYKAAFSKLPETEAELTDAIKIANGRFPSVTSDKAEQQAKEQFYKIYNRVADMNNANDAAAIKVMAYGLRQKAQNRNLNSEKTGIKTFKAIYGYTPKTTEDWNTMQAITYSGATKKIDSDKDGLADETEIKLGTNPNNADSDSDGYKDGTEVLEGYNPKGEGKL